MTHGGNIHWQMFAHLQSGEGHPLFAKRLKQLRKMRKLSMLEMAEAVGVAKSTYAGYESGYRQPTLDTVQLISKKLDTSSDYLLGLTTYVEPIVQATNARSFFNNGPIHWDGIPLAQEDIDLIRKLAERLSMVRTPAAE